MTGDSCARTVYGPRQGLISLGLGPSASLYGRRINTCSPVSKLGNDSVSLTTACLSARSLNYCGPAHMLVASLSQTSSSSSSSGNSNNKKQQKTTKAPEVRIRKLSDFVDHYKNYTPRSTRDPSTKHSLQKMSSEKKLKISTLVLSAFLFLSFLSN